MKDDRYTDKELHDLEKAISSDDKNHSEVIITGSWGNDKARGEANEFELSVKTGYLEELFHI